MIVTLIFLIATACFAKVLYISIQPDQWLDRLLKWQQRLDAWGAKGGFLNEYRYRSWGGCMICFSRFVAFWSFWAWLLFAPTFVWWQYPFVWLAFVSVSTVLNIKFLSYGDQ